MPKTKCVNVNKQTGVSCEGENNQGNQCNLEALSSQLDTNSL